ncbi:MAG: hypothetical protein FWG87_14805 [Defluviitaleaceae bacterium]|nr:hypothetical protein [Defluviitaleaceae bacterium]
MPPFSDFYVVGMSSRGGKAPFLRLSCGGNVVTSLDCLLGGNVVTSLDCLLDGNVVTSIDYQARRFEG